MVSSTHPQGPVSGARRPLALAALSLFAVACQTPPPVVVNATFLTEPEFASRSPSDIAVLPVEDGTGDAVVQRHLTLLRQEIMRQLPDRWFVPLTASTVDAGLRAAPAVARGDSILVPATLQKLAGHAAEDAVFAVRVERWDESRLTVDRRLFFGFQAAMVANDGTLLWSGSMQGEAKAGGVGASPRDREGMVRSCLELAIREMMQRLPRRMM